MVKVKNSVFHKFNLRPYWKSHNFFGSNQAIFLYEL
jgi:hypothetical protein